MRILITGATGFIGGHLTQRLLTEGHALRAWVRSAGRAQEQLGGAIELAVAGDDPSTHTAGFTAALAACDAVINLAGEPVIGRWSPAKKQRLIASRVDLTRALVAGIGALPPIERPKVMISASAVGYYGDRGAETLDERSAKGEGFLADLCAAWEGAAAGAEAYGVRLARLRIGIVLGCEGGALPAMARPIRLGLGGPLGDGSQYLPWIHIADLVALILRILGDPAYDGAINGVGPNPATNAVMTATIAEVLDRPSFLRVPAFVLRLGLGEASEALLGGQRALPGEAVAHGFEFRFQTLKAALRDLLGAEAQRPGSVPRPGDQAQ